MIDLKRKVLNLPLYVWIIIILVVGYMMMDTSVKNEVVRKEVVDSERNIESEKKVASSNVTVHVFFAPWCGWSKKLMGDSLANDDFSGSPYEIVKKWCDSNGVKCIAHNSDKEGEYINKMGIKGFPSTLLVDGDRKKSLPGFAPPEVFINTIKRFMEDKTFMDIPPAPKPKVPQGKSGKLTCFYAPWCGWSKRMFGDKLASGNFDGSEYDKIKIAAEKMNLEVTAVDAETNKQLAKTFQVNGFPSCWLQYGDNMEKEFGGFVPADRMIPELEKLVKM